MNIEDSQDYINITKKLGLATIFLCAPNTSNKRLVEIASTSSGFVYMVSVFGVTIRNKFEKYTFEAISTTREITNRYKIPLAVGFGISSPGDGKKMLKSGADGIIVGSSLMKIIIENEKDKDKMLLLLSNFTKDLKKICR